MSRFLNSAPALLVSLIGLLLVCGISATASAQPLLVDDEYEPPPSIDHSDWQILVASFADSTGHFRYEALLSDAVEMARLTRYLEHLAGTRLFGMPSEVKLAFWINAYNSCAIKGVLDRWPITTLEGNHDYFEGQHCHAAGRDLSLNEIANDVIRHEFPRDPRVNFALTVGAASSAPLRAEAYVGSRLPAQLEAQAIAFVRQSTAIHANVMEVELSLLFRWWGSEFRNIGGVREFVAARLDPTDAALVRAEINVLTFGEWDWSILTHE